MDNKSARELLTIAFNTYEKKQGMDANDLALFKNIIKVYLNYVEKQDINLLIGNYKEKYIFNEARIEKNNSYEEQLGLGEVYDYIQSFDFTKDYFNLFTTSLIIHSKLYSKCASPEFGGKLRDTTVYLLDTNYEVMDPLLAQQYFNSLIPVSSHIFDCLDKEPGGGYFTYIDNCIKQTTDLIKVQPFMDGNKRTFRALLNLLLKKIKIPPINIDIKEKELYKNALLKAIRENDYESIIHFYYYKICEAIITLDVNYLKELENLKR